MQAFKIGFSVQRCAVVKLTGTSKGANLIRQLFFPAKICQQICQQAAAPPLYFQLRVCKMYNIYELWNINKAALNSTS